MGNSLTFSIDTDRLCAVLCGWVRSKVPVPVTVRNSRCSFGVATGAMMCRLYWELAPSIKARSTFAQKWYG